MKSLTYIRELSFAEGEGFPHDVDGAACQEVRNVPTPGPDDIYQETDLNVGEGDQAAVDYDVVDGNIELVLENNVLAQGILFESEEGSKCDSIFFVVAPAIINCVRPCSMG